MKYIKTYESFNPPFEDVGMNGYLLISKDGKYILDIDLKSDKGIQLPINSNLPSTKTEIRGVLTPFLIHNIKRLYKVEDSDASTIKDLFIEDTELNRKKYVLDYEKRISNSLKELREDPDIMAWQEDSYYNSIKIMETPDSALDIEGFTFDDFDFMEVFSGFSKSEVDF